MANGAQERRDHVVALNLWRNPSTGFEALAIAHSLTQNEPPKIGSGQGCIEISIGKEKVGEAISFPRKKCNLTGCFLVPLLNLS